MNDITAWSLPTALLEMLPEAAPALASRAAEAFCIEQDNDATANTASDSTVLQSDHERSVADIVFEYEARASQQIATTNAAVGSRLREEFSAYRLMVDVGDQVLVPAIDARDDELLSRCCGFLETVLAVNDSYLQDAVVQGILESGAFDDERWSRLRSAAGPLLLREIDRDG